MLNDTMQAALNVQLNAELYSSYLYLSMAAYFESIGMPGMSHWMRRQAKEEQAHGMKFFDYVAQNGRVILAPIARPEMEWASPLAVFEAVLAHEKKVTGLIMDLVKLAQAEGGKSTEEFLQWFVEEQEEEEESAEAVLAKFENAPQGSPAIDQELARRT
jgi:ferritin